VSENFEIPENRNKPGCPICFAVEQLHSELTTVQDAVPYRKPMVFIQQFPVFRHGEIVFPTCFLNK
jgi:hypothetical protein